MKTGHLLGILSWAMIALGCGWSVPIHAQGKTDLLLPPAGSLPQGTGNLPSSSKPAPVNQPPSNIQQAGNNIPKGVVKSRVVARVNGSPILEEEVVSAASAMMEEFKKRVQEQFWSKLEVELMQKALDDMITEEAIIQDASIRIPPQSMKNIQGVANKEFDKSIKRRYKDLASLKTDDEVKEYFAKQGFSIDLMRRSFIRSFLATQWIRELIRDKTDVETTRERLLEYYRSNPQEFLKKERVTWQHIYIDDDRYANKQAARQVAETVWQLLRNAKTEDDFSKIVARYADGFSKARSGVGEGNLRGEIKPVELERFVFEQPSAGQGPVVETSRGFHVFRVTEHTPEQMLSFETVCPELRRKMEERIYQVEFGRLSKTMREKALIEMLNTKGE